VLAIYVDDILPATKNTAAQAEVKAMLERDWDIRDISPAHHFLGMRITRDRSASYIKADLAAMTRRIVEAYGMARAKPVVLPADPNVVLQAAGPGDVLLDTDRYPYSALIGALLYLSLMTRPDISWIVGVLSRYSAKPTLAHWNAAKHVLRYLQGTSELGITYSPSTDAELMGYGDADYAGDRDRRRSTTGFAFMLHGGVISWKSQLQKTVATSTAEAEYMAACATTKEAMWLKTLLAGLGSPVSGPIKLATDNEACLAIIKHHVTSPKAKHIDVAYHFSREQVALGTIDYRHCPTEQMVADILTKPLSRPQFEFCRHSLGIR